MERRASRPSALRGVEGYSRAGTPGSPSLFQLGAQQKPTEWAFLARLATRPITKVQ